MIRCSVFLTAIAVLALTSAVSQPIDSTTVAHYRLGRSLYEQGELHRTGNGVDMDYAKAFELYGQSASLGYPMGGYSLAYMYYKGLGCSQDYAKAVELFRKGAAQGMDNSMYFLGLCLRNGYGVPASRDSATYWLHLADSLGSRQAKQELASMAAENRSEAARELLDGIHNLALPQQGPANTFVRVAHRMPVGEAVAGRYKGYLIQYDWSGRNVVDTRTIELDIVASTGRLTGEWVEQGTDSFHFSAYLRGDSLAFDPVSYGRKDHYNPDTAIAYRLESAGLNVVQSPDAVYLAGNVSMFSPVRGEPSKPVVLALVRNSAEVPIDTKFSFDKVYPNPFHDVLDVQFSLGAAADVGMTVLGITGSQVYLRPAQKLQTGAYSYRLQLPAGLAPGAYVLQLSVNGTPHSYKLLHL